MAFEIKFVYIKLNLFTLSYFNRKPQFVTTHPPKVILFEGILVLYNKEIRELLDMKLFVDCDSDTRLSRRGTIIDFCQRNIKLRDVSRFALIRKQ